jgi:predicted lipoprotein with Yx(FWY)xxD motif
MRTRRELTLVLAAGAAIVAGVLFGVVFSGSHDNASRASRPQPDPAEQVVRVADTKLGRILVDGRARTLYLYTPDRHGRSVCYDSCARIWPPALVRGRPQAGPGITAAALRTTRRKDGRLQVVYHGHPLYLVVSDKRPGQTTGQGYDGVWFVVAPSGRRVLKGAAQKSPGAY